MIRVIEEIDHLSVLDAYKKLENDIIWKDYGYKGKQSGLQHIYDQDPFLSSVGKSTLTDEKFCILNKLYKETIFAKLIKKYKLVRTRFIWLGASSCYTFHRDSSPRIHIPLISNQHSFLIWKQGTVVNLVPGLVYWADTREEHTAINGSDEWRLHLVGSVSN